MLLGTVISARYARSARKTDARFALQGRDQRTGQWLPEEATLELGTTDKKLLA